MARQVGRYRIHEAIASGGMATVHLARAAGPAGFSRILAAKCLHPSLAADGEFALMLLDEARVTARIQHPFVVQTLDVVAEKGDLVVVMEYVHGATLHRLLRRARELDLRIDPAIAVSVLSQVLHGLHAAHEVTDENGNRLGVVHRDVSPQNVLVGADGVARVLDFGIAKALGRAQTTSEGQIKGKLAYMSPEQARGEPVDRRTDVFAAGVVLWEMVTEKRLFAAEDQSTTFANLWRCEVPPASSIVGDVDARMDAILAEALARDPAHRFATAREMAAALEAWRPPATASRVAAWVDALCHDELTSRRARIVEMERTGSEAPPAPADPGGEATKSAHSLSTRAEGPPPRPVWAWPLLAAPVALLALVGGYSLAHRGQSASPTASASSSAPPEAEAPRPAAAATASAASAETSAAPSGSTSAIPAPSSSVPPAHPVQPARPQAGPRPVTPKAKVDCSNPKYIDAQGRTRYRRECLTE